MPAERSELLAAYDAQLRGEAEVRTTPAWDKVGPLWRAAHDDRGFVSYESLAGYDLSALVAATLAHFADETDLGSFEWKTRGHDDLPGLDGVLRQHGLVPEEVETVMVGEAGALAVEVPLRDGLSARLIDDDPDASALLAEVDSLQADVFGSPARDTEALIRRSGGTVEVWAALDDDRIVAGGRLEVVPGTDFAGLWGGATRPEARGLGLYRALTAGRARSALARGHRLLHSDCTAMSRPILEGAGLVAVTTTTPYVWTRRSARTGR